ncbi:MAG TPA: DUF2948 domain-containing protein [Rhodospirillaceae bacterium]|nr:hypothetical protein [Alphaproteobacteria bacterium]OUT42075.1 MAG: hypothetical protein CBB62_07180 [Micavibrio sp. TMED2]HCI47990.1 DUF2948 domain-containing protein [Rhodospirillaceae bacterium]MAS46315.1 hypothetical protein [Alphaproteobacteria bacterium]MAX95499.1 hypothetical protein [Alphaproteobacteria bacterium]
MGCMVSDMTQTRSVPATIRLKAEDDEDLCIISAMVQDAILPVRDIGYDSEELRFAMVINRFMWERCDPEQLDGPVDPDSEQPNSFFRTLSAIRFEQVSRVEQHGIDQTKECHMLGLLAIEQLDEHTVLIHFAGDASIRLTMVEVDCHFEDLGEAWPTLCRPAHDLEGNLSVDCEQEAAEVAKHGEPLRAD